MNSSVLYYTQVLGFVNAEWGSDEFTVVSRDGASISLMTKRIVASIHVR